MVWFFGASVTYKTPYLLDLQQLLILYSSYFNVGITFMLMFVSWKKGRPCWVKIAPKLYYIGLISLYLVVPAINIIVAVALILYPPVNLISSINETWCVLFMII